MGKQKKRDPTHSGGRKEASRPKSRPDSKRKSDPERILNENVERLSGVVGKGIELAEAGLAIGARLLGSLGKVGADAVLSRVMDAPPAGASARNEPAAPQAEADTAQPSQPMTSWITNRMPLHAGGDVRVSFSLNNDSSDGSKKIALKVSALLGTTRNGRVPEEALSVTPAQTELAPLDFEKFVLMGTLPPDIQPDTYRGVVTIEGSESFSIPVCLTVE